MKDKKTILSMKFIIILFLAFFPSIAQSRNYVTLSVEDATGIPCSSGDSIKVSLTNSEHRVSIIETLLVDEDNNLTCTGCAPDPVRAPGFMCYAHEQDEGGCKVVMIDVDASELIEIGNGAVFTVDYVVSTADYVVSCVGTPDQCINVAPTDSIIADDLGKSLSVREESGEICFIVCGDVYPGGDDCGDGVVNIFDILEEIDISLDVVDKPSDCQLERGNVPTSLPPDCVDPDDEINLFDILVIIDKALGKPNCCDCTTTSTKPTTTSSIPTTTSSILTTTSSVATTTSAKPTTTSSIPTTTSSIPTTTSSILTTTSSIATTTSAKPTTTSSILTTTSSIPTTTSSIPTTTSSIPTTTSSILTTTSSVATTTSSIVTTTTSTIRNCASKIYRGGVCEESSPFDTIYNRPGRRGLSITCCEEEQFCVCTSCEGEDAIEHCWFVAKISGDPDFEPADDLVDHTGVGDSFTLKVADPCTEHCPDEVVYLRVIIEDCAVPGIELDSVEVQIGRVALGMGTTNAHPGSQSAEVEILLWNSENHVKAIQTDVCGCEMDNCKEYGSSDACDNTLCGQIGDETECGNSADCQWKTVGGVPQCANLYSCAWVGGDIGCVAQDNMVCTACVVDEDRSAAFICSSSEQPDGCCRVTLYTGEPNLIQQREGAVARVLYNVGEEMTSKDCVCLVPDEIKVSDQFNEFLCAVPKPGEICFRICGDIYPQDCYECESCGDGIVDLFDELEAMDIVLGLQTATECQILHGDVPLGVPPYCGNPAGVNPPNCETDGVIDVFDALVIIDKSLSKMNCCDYCVYGEIY